MAARELAQREGDGIVVRLVWDDAEALGREVIVEYRDERRGEFFTFYPPRHLALDAFYHPNAYDSRQAYAPLWPLGRSLTVRRLSNDTDA